MSTVFAGVFEFETEDSRVPNKIALFQVICSHVRISKRRYTRTMPFLVNAQGYLLDPSTLFDPERDDQLWTESNCLIDIGSRLTARLSGVMNVSLRDSRLLALGASGRVSCMADAIQLP